MIVSPMFAQGFCFGSLATPHVYKIDCASSRRNLGEGGGCCRFVVLEVQIVCQNKMTTNQVLGMTACLITV